MARPNRKFERPSDFNGLATEDATEWANRYEKIGIYNAWQDVDLADNFFVYLGGSAQKWFNGLNPCPRRWRNKKNAAGTADLEDGEIEVKQLFLQAFTKGNYRQFQVGKLLARR